MSKGPVKARVLVSGSVQGVGYRSHVARIARRIGVRGIVRNLDDGRVEVVCEADDKRMLEQFVREISQSNFLIVVEDAQVFLEGEPGYEPHAKQSQKFDVEF
jgi:acylphosphatase